ncbi:MAG: TonB-dependent receptor [Flavobacteriaceae bacterium]
MKIKIQYILLTLFVANQLSAQKKDENIGTEVVNVVKPYTPTISDAFKVKENPPLEDEDNSKKETITYSIYSFPVASTFVPSKGKAANVDQEQKQRLFHNYVTGGFGSYLNLLGELYVTHDINDTDYAAGMFKQFSSLSDIKGSKLDSKFSNTALDLTYGSRQKNYSWNADLGYQMQRQYWYGLPDEFGQALTPAEINQAIGNISQMQSYNNFSLGGKLKFKESIFNGVDLKYNRFWDAYKSAENRFVLKPTLNFDMLNKHVTTEFSVDHLSGSFNQDYSGADGFKYSYTNIGVYPSFGMKKDAWSFSIGAALVYGIDSEHSDNELYFYPRANATLKIVDQYMMFYTGIDGGLEQNSYRNFANENLYVSPTLVVAPTDRQYEVYAGLKGKLASNISYNVKGALLNEKNKPLFVANDFHDIPVIKEMYQYGNSFGVTYDLVRTLRLFGELRADFTKNISFGVNGTFNQYTMDYEAEPWNLPQIELAANLDVNITQKWYAGTKVFFVGDRKDRQTNLDVLPIVATDNVKTVKAYFDANAHVGYKYSDRLTAFLRLNNLGNQAYQKWLNYPVQSFQILLGVNYKFDF